MLALAAAAAGLAPHARAADSSEFWPELSAFVRLDEQTRVYLDASYAKGRESDARSLDLGAYLDVSLMPVLREELRGEDWQRNRYLWARVGYTRIFKASNRDPAEVAEDRGVLALYGRALLPEDTTLEARLRADLRWLSGDYPTRYRFRLEANASSMSPATRSCPTSTPNGSTTRATAAGHARSCRPGRRSA